MHSAFQSKPSLAHRVCESEFPMWTKWGIVKFFSQMFGLTSFEIRDNLDEAVTNFREHIYMSKKNSDTKQYRGILNDSFPNFGIIEDCWPVHTNPKNFLEIYISGRFFTAVKYAIKKQDNVNSNAESKRNAEYLEEFSTKKRKKLREVSLKMISKGSSGSDAGIHLRSVIPRQVVSTSINMILIVSNYIRNMYSRWVIMALLQMKWILRTIVQKDLFFTWFVNVLHHTNVSPGKWNYLSLPDWPETWSPPSRCQHTAQEAQKRGMVRYRRSF